MGWAVIGTWKMALTGAEISADILAKGGTAADAAVEGAAAVEDEPSYHSVGYGGRPDADGHVVLDGGFMDGDTLDVGAVAGIEGFRSPARIARALSRRKANNFLCAAGAQKYAEEHGFEKRDNLTLEAKEIWENEKNRRKELKAYDGHDTVCFLTLDEKGSLASCVSTSGLFMKDPGRVGDSPLAGNGFYADSESGAAAATGMGEEIMKGSLSFLAVHYMAEGLTPMEAAQKAVDDLDASLQRRNGRAEAMSLIALGTDGSWGVGTNIDFPFVYASDTQKPALYIAKKENGRTVIEEMEEPKGR